MEGSRAATAPGGEVDVSRELGVQILMSVTKEVTTALNCVSIQMEASHVPAMAAEYWRMIDPPADVSLSLFHFYSIPPTTACIYGCRQYKHMHVHIYAHYFAHRHTL